jgi:class 3 adenylate cyclase
LLTIVRDPNQVFTLLESIYRAFDETASLRKVFKVETIGDCYVAVAGLPEPRKDHAAVMARFAKAILGDMITVTSGLETQLGPGTSSLVLRIGVSTSYVKRLRILSYLYQIETYLLSLIGFVAK